MKPSKAIVSIVSLIASGSLGVDAMVFDDTVLIPKEDVIANERVEVKQIENIVEAKAPWKGEKGITVKYDMGEPTFTDRIKDRRKQEVIYETVDFGEGGFKVDILLTEKPSTNRFCYTIEGAENYDFFYQPPLTEQEKTEGSSRPPEIEGSYAVYHKTLKNHVVGQENYATGKVMHIPRPQVWELGNEEATKQWADLSYENGQLCVTAPQDFIDNADYTNGVRIDPTFGYTSIGASSDNTQNMRGSGFNLPVTADLVSITYGSEFTGSVERAGALYSSTSPATYTSGSATDRQSAGSNVRGFYTLYASTTPTISAGNYVIVVKSDTSSFFRPYDSVTGVFYIDEASSIVYNGWDASEANVNWGRSFSQYATYAITTATTTTGGAKVRKTTATIYGAIVNTTDSPISNHGFAYSLNSDLETGVSTTSIGTTTLSNFSLDLSGLQEMSTYYYRAFSVNAIGTSTGSILSFTTTAQKTIRLNNGTIRINNGTLDL